jgi:predicted MFS family arabinose efflux permease
VNYKSASAKVGMVMLNAGALLMTMRLGGRLSDRLGSRLLVAGGMSIQAAAMACFGLLSAEAPFYWIAVGLIVHGLGAGLSLAALHRAALSNVSIDEAGAAAGVYSMIRFSGTLLGATLGGVLLQQALETQATTVAAYQQVFFIIAAAAALGAAIGLRLQEN